jgi:hypothetical protein
MHPQHSKRRTETLDYLQSMLEQLRIMAQAEHCDMLAYLIEMACIEASDIARGEASSPVGAARANPRRPKSKGMI